MYLAQHRLSSVPIRELEILQLQQLILVDLKSLKAQMEIHIRLNTHQVLIKAV